MAEACNTEVPVECVIELECTDNSQPFENRIVTICSGGEKLIGRCHKKKRNTGQEEINILFDNRILSQTHAMLLFQEGKLYIKDLCSANGTYLNGKNIGPNDQDQREPVAKQLKTGDILGFGKHRVTRVNSDVIKPIEAKLTIKSPNPSEENGHTKNDQIHGKNYTPFEGRELDQTLTMEPEPMKQFIPTTNSIVVKRNVPVKSMEILEQQTQTEAIKLNSSSTQVLPEEEKGTGEKENTRECDSCESVSQEFYQYRKRALLAIVTCLLVIIIYQQCLSF